MNTIIGNEALVEKLGTSQARVGVFGLAPGLIPSDIRVNMTGAGTVLQHVVEGVISTLGLPPDYYAKHMINLMAHPALDASSGTSFNQDREPVVQGAFLSQPGNLQVVWDASEKLVRKALDAA
jgi:hypothetical protein